MELTWIKMFVSIFSNRKILLLLKERDGDTYFRVWIQLLTIAGQSMNDGKLMMSENVPMKLEDFAIIMNKSNDKMKKILNKLIQLEMIIYRDNVYIIKNWNKYQSVDKYEKVKEQNRERQGRYREKKKLENNVNVTLDNAEEEKIKEKNKIDNNRKDYYVKKTYSNFEQREYSKEDLEKIYCNK